MMPGRQRKQSSIRGIKDHACYVFENPKSDRDQVQKCPQNNAGGSIVVVESGKWERAIKIKRSFVQAGGGSFSSAFLDETFAIRCFVDADVDDDRDTIDA